jgi:hypothetical protein
MRPTFGPDWRTKCHQAAKISARALQMLFPPQRIELQRVELIATMKDGPGFVHLGCPDDPARPVRIPAHFAVTIGASVYDPTFAQLRNVQTHLEMPQEPYFYLQDLLKAEPKAYQGQEGFKWSSIPASTGLLLVGYKLQPAPLPDGFESLLMPDGLARRHARRVADLWRK